LGGYDPKFKIVFGDVDLCLRAIQKGLRVVYAPGAALLHYEGRSRGYLTPVEDMINGFEMMEPWLANGDPFYSPHLTYTTIPACDLNSESDGSRLKNILSRRASLKKFNE
jgi:O-antigen biosynthesis protein